MTPAVTDDLISEAEIVLIERFAFRSKARIGFEVTTQMIDMFGNLLIKEEEIVPILVKEGLYEVKLSALKYEYLHLARATAESEDCPDIKIIIKQHDDLAYALEDAFQKPSRKWKRALGVFAKNSDKNINKNSLYLYVDTNVVLKKIFVDYIRCPKKVFFGGYNSIEYLECKKNTPQAQCTEYYSLSSAPVDSEINEKYHYLLADIVIELFGREYEHTMKAQSSISKQESLT